MYARISLRQVLIAISATALLLRVPAELVAAVSVAASVVDMAATLALRLATSAAVPTTLPVTARLRP